MADIIGSNASQTLNGTAADFIDGLGGSDKLFGRSGNDTIEGGAGNDQLNGKACNDTYFGGSGADKFGFQIDSGFQAKTDTIKDFVAGSDKIQLSQFKSPSLRLTGRQQRRHAGLPR